MHTKIVFGGHSSVAPLKIKMACQKPPRGVAVGAPVTPPLIATSHALGSPASWSQASSAHSPPANPDGQQILEFSSSPFDEATPRKKMKSTKCNEKRLDAEMQKAEMAYAAQRHSQDMEKVNEAMRNSVPLTNRILMQIIKEEQKSQSQVHIPPQCSQGRADTSVFTNSCT